MTLSRRRFLSITAGMACAPMAALAETWHGRAFGAEVSMTIRGGARASAALQDARAAIREIEDLFNLYDPSSALVRLNMSGLLNAPDPRFLELMRAANDAFLATNGLFDPTVQRLWEGAARGENPALYAQTIGWDRVAFNAARIHLGEGQALTFNGIAQGYATDKVTEILLSHGLTDILVNIGEHRGVGGPWRLGLTDPVQGHLGMRTLSTGAIATSSPQATPLGEFGHILHASKQPQWSSVTVEAQSATVADSLSTALVLASRKEIDAIRARVDLARITLVDKAGDLVTL